MLTIIVRLKSHCVRVEIIVRFVNRFEKMARILLTVGLSIYLLRGFQPRIKSSDKEVSWILIKLRRIRGIRSEY